MTRSLPIIIALLAVSAAGCGGKRAPALARYETTREMMGTFVTVTLWCDSDERAAAAGEAAFAVIARLEAMMSIHRGDSEISEVNRTAAARPVAVSDDLLAVLKQSLHYAELSGGAFDITMAPLGKLWRDAAAAGQPPSSEDIAAVLPLIGWDKVKLDEEHKTVRFERPGMALDLGGIAKGYAADRALAELKRQGIGSAMVNAGGNIAASGTPPDSPGWRVAMQKPGASRGERLPETVLLNEAGVSTSGDYERYVEIGAKRYSHIIDPRSGLPVERMSGVTVISPDATSADALSTACSVLGPAEGLKLVATLPGVEVMYVVMEDSGPAIAKSPGFDGRLAH